jgi:hypothetical protein
MSKFRIWWLRNQTEITWFIIGWLTVVGFQDLFRGDYFGALISFVLVYINYKFNR